MALAKPRRYGSNRADEYVKWRLGKNLEACTSPVSNRWYATKNCTAEMDSRTEITYMQYIKIFQFITKSAPMHVVHLDGGTRNGCHNEAVPGTDTDYFVWLTMSRVADQILELVDN